MRAWILAAALVPLTGCSFIDDWGSLTTEPGIDGGDMDGGDMDGGGPGDAGDSDAATCNECGAGCGADEVCGYDPIAECEVCMPDDSPQEGSPCSTTAECEDSGLVCFSGVCARACDPSVDECVDAMFGPLCIEWAEGGVCFGALCDPVEQSCPDGLACGLLGFDPEGNVATACHGGSGTVPEGEACTGGTDCVAGAICADPDFDGTATCHTLCWTDGDCLDGRACGPIGTPSGAFAMVEGRGLGACTGGTGRQGAACADRNDCYALGLCQSGACHEPCETDAECPAGSGCVDLDGDGNTECR